MEENTQTNKVINGKGQREHTTKKDRKQNTTKIQQHILLIKFRNKKKTTVI